MSFVSLHTHTSHSVLDGASKIPELVGRARELGMPAIGISDHGGLNGVIDFYKECKAQGIKPVLGMEAYFADDRLVKEMVKQENENGMIDGSDKRYYHLSLYAADNEGYQNLIKISSDAHLNGKFYKPRTDYAMLEQYGKGLIVGSGCLGGPVLQNLLHDNFDGALKAAGRLQDCVGRDNFYIELMRHGLSEQDRTNPYLIDIAKKIGAQIYCTQDTHYTHKGDAVSHDALLCTQTGAKMADEKRFRFHNDEYYLKSPEQMRELFSDLPQACDTTLLIAEKCDVSIDFDTLHLPSFPIPQGFADDNAYLRYLVELYMDDKYDGAATQVYVDRLEYELSVIKSLNLASYFLIFWDLVNFTVQEKILTGPGRGSSAGSLVSYLLGITKLDPIQYDLLFERFINKDRIALADVDWDIDTRHREKIINYTKEKYGNDRVGQIITFSKIKSRTAVRDAARVLGYDFAMGDRIAKAMPPLLMGRDTPLAACFELDPDYEAGYKNAQGLRQMYSSDPDAKKIIDVARGLEGLIRQHGVGAAAVVIGDRPLDELVPLELDKDGNIITQFDKNTVEELGLLKMDYLGLRNLDIIADTLDRLGFNFDFLEHLVMDDFETFNTLGRGEGVAVFQVEGPQMRDLLRRMQPNSIDDIAAVLALYRPGPMSSNMHYDYADRKNGRKPIEYFHSDAKDILDYTYGLMIYQEQVMQVAQRFAGYTMSEADNLRKIMGKKLPEKMKQEKAKFVKGCVDTGYDPSFSKSLFNMIEAFADYGFAKSHAYAYGYITYWTAYLKTHFPREYMASLCTSVMDDLDRSAVYLNETRNMGLHVYPPDLNRSELIYTVEEDGIRIGLGAMKHFGEGAAQKLIDERKAGGHFTSLYDFAKRINPNIQAFKSLAYSGSLDSFGTRQGIAAIAEDVLTATRKERKKNHEHQGSLLNLLGDESALEFHIPDTEFSEAELLRKEKDTIGIYVSGHPLNGVKDKRTKFSVSDLKELPDQKELVKVLVMVTDVNVKFTKKGDSMAEIQIEDQTGSVPCVVFPKKWQDTKGELIKKGITYVTVRIGRDFKDERNYVLMGADNIDTFTPIVEEVFGIHLPKKFHLNPQYMSKLKGIVLSHSGGVPLQLYRTRSAMLKLSNEYYVTPSDELKVKVKKLFDSFRKDVDSKKGK